MGFQLFFGFWVVFSIFGSALHDRMRRKVCNGVCVMDMVHMTHMGHSGHMGEIEHMGQMEHMGHSRHMEGGRV